MLFSSPLFLFAFLPLCLALYYACGRRARNWVLLLASLFFYAWGEAWLVSLMLVSIGANYGFGRWIERRRQAGRARAAVATAVAFDLGLLFVFKYADWLWSSLGSLVLGHAPAPLGGRLFDPQWAQGVLLTPLEELRLPLGISFFTFQALSYVIDVGRGEVRAQRNLRDFALYIAMFPQLIAGPIVRYRDVAGQIVARSESLGRFASGVRRFVIGLGKKVLIANTVGAAAEELFAVPPGELTAAVAWLGVLAYSVQIYFDFSGYSDMAIGLGRMFGFELIENFRYPYVAQSVTEFWRRWHISLSTWFRDYLYVPMGGGRVAPARVYFNLVTVFVLCGLWHGASWNYLLFGCFHGLLLVTERAWLGARLVRAPRAFRHAYLLLAVGIGWVFFRCEDVALLRAWLAAMFGFAEGDGALYPPGLFLDNARHLAIVAGVLGSLPWLEFVRRRWTGGEAAGRPREWPGWCGDAALALTLVLCAFELSAGTFNPFIYFRF